MWTIILLDHNGHREERKWKDLPPPVFRRPVMEKIRALPTFDVTSHNLTRPLQVKEYYISSWNPEEKKAIYLEKI